MRSQRVSKYLPPELREPDCRIIVEPTLRRALDRAAQLERRKVSEIAEEALTTYLKNKHDIEWGGKDQYSRD